MKDGSFFGTLPIQATVVAGKVDLLYEFLVWLSVFFTVLVVGGMLYFAWVYRRRPGHKSTAIHGNTLIEIIWTVVPTFIVIVIFVWGWVVYKEQVTPPYNAYEIKVLGKQWSWQFIYNNGTVMTGQAYIPVNKPVKLIMTSEDVLHSFFVPNFRVKQDVVPGMYTSVWFEATIEGEHQVYCAEYCGGLHSGMLAKLIALNDENWDKFLRGKEIKLAEGNTPTTDQLASSAAKPEAVPLIERGRHLSEVKACTSCHSVDGSFKAAPSFKGLFGKSVELSSGKNVVVDDNYLRESIEKPAEKIVKGFSPVMPTYRGQLSEIEMASLIAYIRSLQ